MHKRKLAHSSNRSGADQRPQISRLTRRHACAAAPLPATPLVTSCSELWRMVAVKRCWRGAVAAIVCMPYGSPVSHGVDQSQIDAAVNGY